MEEEIKVEPHDGTDNSSSDDGGPTRTVWGCVWKGGQPHAVYHARWTPGHLEQGIQILVGIGGWGDGGAGPSARYSVGVECLMGSDRPEFVVVDATTLPWTEEFFGVMLTREEALTKGAAAEAFPIFDEIVQADSRLRNFLIAEEGGYRAAAGRRKPRPLRSWSRPAFPPAYSAPRTGRSPTFS